MDARVVAKQKKIKERGNNVSKDGDRTRPTDREVDYRPNPLSNWLLSEAHDGLKGAWILH